MQSARLAFTLARAKPLSLPQARQFHFHAPAAVFTATDRVCRGPLYHQFRTYADKVVKVPQMAESISEGTLKQWIKNVGDFVKQDDEVATIETDKVDVTVNSPASGTIIEIFANEEDNVAVGADFFKLELGEAPKEGSAPPPSKPKSKPAEEAPAPEQAKEQAPASVPQTEAPKPQASTPKPTPQPTSSAAAPAPEAKESADKTFGVRTEKRVKMNRMRSRIAERLKQSQDTAASLTTFNEIDMSAIMELRSKYKDLVLKKHGVKLGFMSAFAKASALALQEIPAVNATIDGSDIVYHDFIDMSIAVSTPKGLVTPVLRNVEDMSFVDIERNIADMGKKARDNKMTIEDMVGGTFTISNGGVFGSLMGTPIINLPQSAILGMHAIKERPIAINGKIEIRPMMYVALTYDHRLIDGREAVTFLVKIKDLIEDPGRFLVDV